MSDPEQLLLPWALLGAPPPPSRRGYGWNPYYLQEETERRGLEEIHDPLGRVA
jgi:hypothetical protein